MEQSYNFDYNISSNNSSQSLNSIDVSNFEIDLSSEINSFILAVNMKIQELYQTSVSDFEENKFSK
jgi:hypothetical protein